MKLYRPAITAAVTVAGVALSAAVWAPTSPTAPAQAAYTAAGVIRPADNPHWCLTRPDKLVNNAKLSVLPCVKGDAAQSFFAWRIPQAGGIDVNGSPDFQVALKGIGTAVLLTNISDPSKYTTVIAFTPYEKGWLVDVKIGKRVRFMTVPASLKGAKPIAALWLYGDSSNKKTQEWLFEPWKKLDA
jgi:hypothetical protein